MNPKNTWFLVFLAACLFAFIYFVERRIQPPHPVVARVWTGMDTDLVSVIEISPKGMSTIRLERTNGVWQMTKPVVYPVKIYAVNDFLRALAALTPHYRVTAKELQSHKDVSADFGFDPPRVTILLQQGDDKFLLNLGNVTSPGDEIFTQVVGTDGLDVIGTDFLKVLPFSANEWRDTAFARFDDPNIDQLVVKSGGGTLKFQRDTNKVWAMTDPIRSPADNREINTLLDQTRNARVTQFISDNVPGDPAALAAWGLQPPVVELGLFDGTNQVAALQFGNATNDDLYARAGASAPVVFLARGKLDEWRAGPSAFRDRNLVSIPDWTVLQQGFSVDVTAAGGRTIFTVRCATNGSIWVTDTNQQSYPVDQNVLVGFFKQLHDLQIAQAYANPSTFAVKDIVQTNDRGDYGLADSNLVRRYQLSLTPPGGPVTVLAQLDFGLPNTNYEGTLFVRRGHVQEDAVYAVSNNDFNHLPSRALDLRSRQVWTNFSAADVAGITVSSNNRAISLARRGTADWLLVSGQGIGTDEKQGGTEGVVENLLGALRAESWVGRVDQDPPKLGFSDSSLWIEVRLNDGEKKRIDFGGLEPVTGGRYAAVTLDGQRWVFVFSRRDWGDLTSRLWMPMP